MLKLLSNTAVSQPYIGNSTLTAPLLDPCRQVTFDIECSEVQAFLARNVGPEFCGRAGVIFDIQNGIVRGREEVINRSVRKKRD